MLEAFGVSAKGIGLAFQEIKDLILFGIFEMQQLSSILENYNIVFSDEKQAHAFFSIIIDAINNTRIWPNKGHTPLELSEISDRRHSWWRG